MTTDLTSLTVREMLDGIRKGAFSRQELVAAHLDRIAKLNNRVNAIVDARAEEALGDARAADDNAANRRDLPLDGIPVSIKDHFDVAGMRHTEGVKAMAERRSPADEEAVRRLKAAGAIIIGKANQPDMQIRWNTISSLFGETRNPRDPSLTAGGSSGGDAAAVAAGMAAIGLGADYGGSIRVPASFCGIYGLRPSSGVVPAVPELAPLDANLTADMMNSPGPLARSIDDLRIALRVLAGPDPRDPVTVPVRLDTEAAGKAPPRVARMVDETGARVTPEIEARLDAVAEILAEAGYEVVDGGIPQARRAPEIWGELVGTELCRGALPEFRSQLGESNRQHIEMMFSLFDLGSDVSRFIAGFIERRSIARQTALWMEDHPLVICPVAGMPTPGIDFDHFLDKDQTIALFDSMRNVVWVNALRLPSVALKNGIQIVARRFREAEALAAAAVVERALGPAMVAGENGTTQG